MTANLRDFSPVLRANLRENSPFYFLLALLYSVISWKKEESRGFIKGQRPGKLIVCEQNFPLLLLTSQPTFSFTLDHIQVNYPAQVQ